MLAAALLSLGLPPHPPTPRELDLTCHVTTHTLPSSSWTPFIHFYLESLCYFQTSNLFMKRIFEGSGLKNVETKDILLIWLIFLIKLQILCTQVTV